MSVLQFAFRESIAERVLAALRCVDATSGAPVLSPLEVTAGGATFVRNRSGLHVLKNWSPLATHNQAFVTPPASPPLGSQSLTISITDPSLRYLPRLFSLALPRDADPSNASLTTSVFQAVNVPLFPSGTARVEGNWSVVRVTLTAAGSGDALGGALLRVMQGATVLGCGFTDWRGEGLVLVAGVPITTWSDDPGVVVVSEIAVTVEAYFDSATGSRSAMNQVLAGVVPSRLPQANPEALEALRAGLPSTSAPRLLAAGREIHQVLQVVVP